MGQIKIELDSNGISEILRSEEAREKVAEKAQEVCSRAQSGGLEYGTDTIIGPHRAVARVYPASIHAYYSNLKNNTLLKALS